MLLIFDLDGTLFQAKPVVLRTALLFCREAGFSMPDNGQIYKSADAFLRAVLPEGEDLLSARRRYDVILHDAVRDCGTLFPGVRETLDVLRREGHEMIVCSASGLEYVRLALMSTGISGLFGSFYSAEGYPSKAELIAKVITPGAQAAVIGDTHGDIDAARALGLPSIAAMYGYGNRELLKDADFFAESPEDIADCVRALAAGL